MSIFRRGTIIPVSAPQPQLADSAYFGAPWVGSHLDLLGRYETDPVLNKRLVPEWRHMARATDYTTLSGNEHAWCALLVSSCFRKVGITSTNDPAAASYSAYGTECRYSFGAILPIRHQSGGRHVCFFLYWLDKASGMAATLDGNKGNRFSVTRTRIHPSADSVVPGPRWPASTPLTRLVPMAEVLASYPQLTVDHEASESTT